MKAGDIIFIDGGTLKSWLIKKLLKSQFSHVALAVSETDIIEIDFLKKVQQKPNPYKNYCIGRVKGVNTEQLKEVVKFAESKIGVSYDYLQILGLFLETVFNIRNYINQRNRLICSELIYLAYYSQGIDLMPNKSIEDITPEDLYESPLIEITQD